MNGASSAPTRAAVLLPWDRSDRDRGTDAPRTAEHRLAEAVGLAASIGLVVVHTAIVPLRGRRPSTLLGEGPEPGDVIHALNGVPIKDLQQLRQELHKAKPGDSIVLQVERSGLLTYLVLETE